MLDSGSRGPLVAFLCKTPSGPPSGTPSGPPSSRVPLQTPLWDPGGIPPPRTPQLPDTPGRSERSALLRTTWSAAGENVRRRFVRASRREWHAQDEGAPEEHEARQGGAANGTPLVASSVPCAQATRRRRAHGVAGSTRTRSVELAGELDTNRVRGARRGASDARGRECDRRESGVFYIKGLPPPHRGGPDQRGSCRRCLGRATCSPWPLPPT